MSGDRDRVDEQVEHIQQTLHDHGQMKALAEVEDFNREHGNLAEKLTRKLSDSNVLPCLELAYIVQHQAEYEFGRSPITKDGLESLAVKLSPEVDPFGSEMTSLIARHYDHYANKNISGVQRDLENEDQQKEMRSRWVIPRMHTEDRIATLMENGRGIFNYIDENQDGQITKREIARFLEDRKSAEKFGVDKVSSIGDLYKKWKSDEADGIVNTMEHRSFGWMSLRRSDRGSR